MVRVFSWKVFLEFWVYDQNDKEKRSLENQRKYIEK